jgi:hypothetical protein
MGRQSVSALVAVFMAGGVTGLASSVCSDPLPRPMVVRGTQAGTTGPNLVADSGFESMDTRPFTLETPFQVAASMSRS